MTVSRTKSHGRGGAVRPNPKKTLRSPDAVGLAENSRPSEDAVLVSRRLKHKRDVLWGLLCCFGVAFLLFQARYPKGNQGNQVLAPFLASLDLGSGLAHCLLTPFSAFLVSPKQPAGLRRKQKGPAGASEISGLTDLWHIQNAFLWTWPAFYRGFEAGQRVRSMW